MSSPASPRGRSDVHNVSGSSSPSLWTDPVLASPSLSVQVPSPPLFRLNLRPLPLPLIRIGRPLRLRRWLERNTIICGRIRSMSLAREGDTAGRIQKRPSKRLWPRWMKRIGIVSFPRMMLQTPRRFYLVNEIGRQLIELQGDRKKRCRVGDLHVATPKLSN